MSRRRFAARLLLTLFVGVLGGGLFHALSLPLPWLLGSMCAVAALALLGQPVVSVRRIRPPFSAIIGVTLGSAFSPDVTGHALDWLPLTGTAVVSTLLLGALGTLYLVRVARFDLATAYFGGMPAGIYEMVNQGGAAGGDERRIALVQALRIFLVVLSVPIAFRLVFDLEPSASARIGGVVPDAGHALVLVACVLVGWPLARLLRLPTAPLVGPMAMSAVLHAAGIVEGGPPVWIVAAAQVVVGGSIGGQFLGMKLAELRTTALHGLALVPLMLAACAIAAALVTPFLEVGPFTVFLALGPGGLAEMSLVALAMQAEVAAVVFHQILRISLIHALAALVFRAFPGHRRISGL